MSVPGLEANEPWAAASPHLLPPPPPPPQPGYVWPAAHPPGMQPVPSDSIPAAWGGMPPEAWAGYAPPEAWGYAAAPPNCLPSDAPLDQQALEQWQLWQQWQQYEAATAAQQQAAGLAMYQGYPYQQAPLFAISPPGPPHRAHQRRLERKPKAALPAEPSFGSNSDAEGGALLVSGEPSQVEVAEPGAGAAGGGGGTPAGTPPSGRPPRPHRRSHSAGGAVPPTAARPAPLHRYPSVAYDRAPRPVQFKPYTLADYQQRGYDAKASPKFWTLGGLGPTHGGGSFASSTSSDSSEGGPSVLQGDALWQAQQQKRDRQQQFGQTASQQNRARLAALPPRQRAPPPRPGAEVRERAMRFAQSGVPKPSSFRARDQPSLEAAASAAVAEHEAGEGAGEAPAVMAAEEAAAGERSCTANEEVAEELQALQLEGPPGEMAIADAVPHAASSPEPVVGC